jgi:NAD(P)-dependent dehydrogenase (short-subunit alcohol dehydrogenase family)
MEGAVRVLTDIVLCIEKNSALEFGAHGITVNAYAPGPVKSQMCTLIHLSKDIFLHPLGDDIVAARGAPKEVFEEQVRISVVRSAMYHAFNKNVWIELKACCSRLYWGANRRRGVGLLPRF